ncbi:MAG: cupin domain-containing protein [Patescibacteria group bacterium]
MQGYTGNVEQQTLDNENFRTVVFTGPNIQLVLMTLQPGEEIGAETHDGHDQFFRFEEGEAKVLIGGEEKTVQAGGAAIVPAGTLHNIINASETEKLKLYTLYAPPQHAQGTVHKTKAEADEAEKHAHESE